MGGSDKGVGKTLGLKWHPGAVHPNSKVLLHDSLEGTLWNYALHSFAWDKRHRRADLQNLRPAGLRRRLLGAGGTLVRALVEVVRVHAVGPVAAVGLAVAAAGAAAVAAPGDVAVGALRGRGKEITSILILLIF